MCLLYRRSGIYAALNQVSSEKMKQNTLVLNRWNTNHYWAI